MKDFQRNNQLLSLCGLNCGLCTMHLGGYCPGCGGGAGNQTCKIARCSIEHDHLEYCFECSSYPCDKYAKMDKYDSFITHQHYYQDALKAKKQGLEVYNREQQEKINILTLLLDKYNDGRKKSFYCLAVNLLELEDLNDIIRIIKTNQNFNSLSLKEQVSEIVELFQDKAKEHNIVLKLKKKPKN